MVNDLNKSTCVITKDVLPGLADNDCINVSVIVQVAKAYEMAAVSVYGLVWTSCIVAAGPTISRGHDQWTASYHGQAPVTIISQEVVLRAGKDKEVKVIVTVKVTKGNVKGRVIYRWCERRQRGLNKHTLRVRGSLIVKERERGRLTIKPLPIAVVWVMVRTGNSELRISIAIQVPPSYSACLTSLGEFCGPRGGVQAAP